MPRIVVIDPHPAVRAGIDVLLRAEPGLVGVGFAAGADEGIDLVKHQRPDVVVMEAEDLATCRRLRALDAAPRVVLYSAVEDASLAVAARVAGADGLVNKAAPAHELFEAIRLVARGHSALPPLSREQLDAAAHLVDPDDLALLAMLVDRTEPAEVAATLRVPRRQIGRRIERMLKRLRTRPPRSLTAS